MRQAILAGSRVGGISTCGISRHGPYVIDSNDGERGRNRTFNLLIKSQSRLSIHGLATHNEPITYKSLARTENQFQMLETLAMLSNVQPHLPQAIPAHVSILPSRSRNPQTLLEDVPVNSR